jgi:hypothetical protein
MLSDAGADGYLSKETLYLDRRFEGGGEFRR